MVDNALAIAAGGMQAQKTNVEVIANNIANINTNGFQRQMLLTEDLGYQTIRSVGSPSGVGASVLPTGLQLGTGTRSVATVRVQEKGDAQMTENKLDMMVHGEGLFKVVDAQDQFLYTNKGEFTLNENGEVVTYSGLKLEPAITIPQDATDLTINPNGEVFVNVAGSVHPQSVGKITLTRFVNPAGLNPRGGGLFQETQASGPPIENEAGLSGMGEIVQYALESSNVKALTEITRLIEAQRAYEMNSKTMKTTDEMLSELKNIKV